MTHSNLTNPKLRKILHDEILVLRKTMKKAKVDWKSDLVRGILIGLETALRRVQDQREAQDAKLQPVE
jgi:hypothetical protein